MLYRPPDPDPVDPDPVDPDPDPVDPPPPVNVDPYWDLVLYQLRMASEHITLVDDKPNTWHLMNSATMVADAGARDGGALALDTPENVNEYEQSAQAFTRSTAGKALGTGDFTVEFRVKLTQNAIWDSGRILDTGAIDIEATWENPVVSWRIYIDYQPGFTVYVSDNRPGFGNHVDMLTTGDDPAFNPDEWVDVAWVRKDGISRIYVNGVNKTTGANNWGRYPVVGDGVLDDNDYSEFFKLHVGLWQMPDSGWVTRGTLIDFVRITKAARYLTNYDPSTIQFHIP